MHMQITDNWSVVTLYVVFATHEHACHTAEDPATNELILYASIQKGLIYDHSHDDHYRLQTEYLDWLFINYWKLLVLNCHPCHERSVEPYVL
jgi:hypothetical protein